MGIIVFILSAGCTIWGILDNNILIMSIPPISIFAASLIIITNEGIELLRR
jgi:hypothetical protein